mmetsp:Transcript_26488/g.89131  ORF Transcript_26488/g.89131 Transcript_26488/m.89131 type:complete len:192 (+) Transcript_26488:957-1532(+)
MMYCALALLLAPAAALVAPAAQSRRVQTITHAFVGATSPMGYFDPLQFSKDKSDETISKYREHELKHGRVAMLSMAGIFVEPWFHPLATSCHITSVTNPIQAGIELPFAGKAQILGYCAVVELLANYVKKAPGYKAGDLLGASYYTDENNPLWISYQEKELNNGRLAMMAFAGFVAQYFITGNVNDALFLK